MCSICCNEAWVLSRSAEAEGTLLSMNIQYIFKLNYYLSTFLIYIFICDVLRVLFYTSYYLL